MSSIAAGTTTTTGYVVTSDSTGALVLKTGASATTAVTIDTSQRVIIGQTSGTQRLTVNPTMDVTDGTITTRLAQSSGAALIGTTTGHAFFFMTNDTERARISSTGNFGIGNTSPAVRLDVLGGTLYDGNFYLISQFRNAATSAEKGILLGYNNADTSSIIAPAYASGSGALAFWTQNNVTWGERGRINRDGSFLINTTNVYNGERLVVDSNGGSAAYNSKFVNSSTSNTTYSATTWSHGQSGTAIGYVGVGGSAVSNGAFANNFVVGTQSASALVFTTSDSEKARFDASGNFTLGFAASPYNSAKMEIYRASAGDALILTSPVGTGNSNAIAWSNSRGDVVSARIYNVDDGAYGAAIAFANRTGVGTATTERMRITSGGNVGIGTNAPAYKFVVQDSANETISSIKNTSSTGKDYVLISGGASGAFAGGRFGLYSVTDATELLAATSNTASTAGGTTGKGIGFSNAGFWIDRGWADFPSMTVCSTNYVGNTNQSQIRMHGTNATWASYPSGAGGDFACSFFIDGTYQTSSDRRFKTNITNIDNALDKVMAMTGKRYQTVNKIGEVETAASQSGYKYGFIAQDLQAAGLDELYKHYADEDDFTEGYNKAYSVEYDAVVPLLVNAIKEQQAIIQQLQADVAALKGTA